MSAVKLLLVEDHRLVRESLRALLEDEVGLELELAEAGSAAEALAQAMTFRPELILLDLSLPDLDGLTALRLLRERAPRARVLVLMTHASPEQVLAAARAGASGSLLKGDSAEELREAIRCALHGEPEGFYLSRELERRGLRGLPRRQALLTPREREVLRLFGHGLRTKEIAVRLGISVKTVETHRRHIQRKLGLRSWAELVRYALNAMGNRDSTLR